MKGPKEEESFKAAQSLVMTDTPSSAAKELVRQVCDKDKPLETCCCSKVVSSLWRDMLPKEVRTHVSDMGLKDPEDFKKTLDAADKAYSALKGPNAKVSALTKSVTAGEVAAVRGGGSRGRGRGAMRGQSRGTSSTARGGARRVKRVPEDKSTWGDPHPDGPPPEACMQHYIYGKSAWICRKINSCPWANLAKPPNDESK